MSFDERNELIKKISEIRQSNVICYISGDRQSISTRIAPDIIPVIHKHLEEIGNNQKIDLFLSTKGGDVLTALRLVHLIYEYTENFSVIVPHKAYSAGTLIALGSSEILMTKMGELSPVDPSVTSAFNPKDPLNDSARLPISVEDLYSFITITKDIVGIKNDEALARILDSLLEHVHPLAIGSIYRTYSLIRSVAKKLLMIHIDKFDEEKINEIIDNLTEQLFSHSYMITRKEAKEVIKLPVSYTDDEMEKNVWDLYKIYEKDLFLNKPFIPEENVDTNGRFVVSSGLIESVGRTDSYIFEGAIHGINEMNGSGNINITYQGWKKIREE